MPQGDRTGPNAEGPRTGRGIGFCSGFNSPGFMNGGFGRGLGRGRGFARRNMARPIQEPIVITKEQEKKYLEEDLETLKQEMKEIQERLKNSK